MVVATSLIESFIGLLIMAVALGMDAFSVGMGMGMTELRVKQIFYIGLTIGLFHMVMPLLGMGIGHILSEHFGSIARTAGGILLLVLGAQMFFSSFQKEEKMLLRPVGFGLIVFALSVSLDSFSVGLSLGIFGARVLVTVILFGAVSMVLTWTGLIAGRKFQRFLGPYSEACGGFILFVFGVKLLLHL